MINKNIKQIINAERFSFFILANSLLYIGRNMYANNIPNIIDKITGLKIKKDRMNNPIMNTAVIISLKFFSVSM